MRSIVFDAAGAGGGVIAVDALGFDPTIAFGVDGGRLGAAGACASGPASDPKFGTDADPDAIHEVSANSPASAETDPADAGGPAIGGSPKASSAATPRTTAETATVAMAIVPYGRAGTTDDRPCNAGCDNALDNASDRAATSKYRASGSFSRHRITTASSPEGTSGRSACSEGGEAVAMRAPTAAAFCPSKGRFPVSNS